MLGLPDENGNLGAAIVEMSLERLKRARFASMGTYCYSTRNEVGFQSPSGSGTECPNPWRDSETG